MTITNLIERVKLGEVKELIMAISPTIEGDTTIYYLSKQLEQLESDKKGLIENLICGISNYILYIKLYKTRGGGRSKYPRPRSQQKQI